MITICRFLAAHGGALLAGTTSLLALGCVGVAFHRSAIHRQRASQMTVLAVIVWLILACLPLPRVRLFGFGPAEGPRADSAPREQVSRPTAPVLEPMDDAVVAGGASEEVSVPRAESPPADLGVPVSSFSAAEETGTTTPAPPASNAAQPRHEENPASAGAPRGRGADNPTALHFREVLPVVYVAGVVGCFAWLALGRLLLLRVIRSATLPAPWLRELYEGLPFAGRRRPRLLISGRCPRALSFGLWRPTVVVPEGLCRPRRAGPLRHVLMHELAHVGQGDALGRFLFNLAFPLLYFHPLYWWLRSRAYLAAELIADDNAARQGPKASYVEALIVLAKEHGLQQVPCFGLQGLLGSQSQFYRRMQMLVSRETRLASRCSRRWRWIYPTACFLTVALVASAVGVQSGRAQEAPVASEKKAVDLREFCPWEKKRAELAAELAQVEQMLKQLEDRRAQLEAEVAQARSKLAAKTQQQLHAQNLLMQIAEKEEELRKREADVRARAGTQADAESSRKAYEQLLLEFQERVATYQDQLKQLADTEEKLRKRAADVRAKAGTQANAESRRKAYEQLLRAVPGLSEAQAQTILDHSRPSTTWAQAPAARQLPAVAEQPAVQGLPFDLVNLATAYADAAGDLELAKARYDRLKELRASNAVSNEEVTTAETNFKTANRKVDLLQSIGISAIKAIKVEVETLHEQMNTLQKESEQSPSLTALRIRLARAQSQLEILERIISLR